MWFCSICHDHYYQLYTEWDIIVHHRIWHISPSNKGLPKEDPPGIMKTEVSGAVVKLRQSGHTGVCQNKIDLQMFQTLFLSSSSRTWSDRTLTWPSNLAISTFHHKNHQQPLGTTRRTVNAHEHPRYFQDTQQSWTKILPLAHAQIEIPWAKNMSYPSNQSQIMKAGSLYNAENVPYWHGCLWRLEHKR